MNQIITDDMIDSIYTKTVDDKTSFDDNSFENDSKDEFGYTDEEDNKLYMMWRRFY